MVSIILGLHEVSPVQGTPTIPPPEQTKVETFYNHFASATARVRQPMNHPESSRIPPTFG